MKKNLFYLVIMNIQRAISNLQTKLNVKIDELRSFDHEYITEHYKTEDNVTLTNLEVFLLKNYGYKHLFYKLPKSKRQYIFDDLALWDDKLKNNIFEIRNKLDIDLYIYINSDHGCLQIVVIEDATNKEEQRDISIKLYNELSKIHNMNFDESRLRNEFDYGFDYENFMSDEEYAKSITSKYDIGFYKLEDIIKSEGLNDCYGCDLLVETPIIKINKDNIETIYEFSN